jgi:hypothetical protein
MMVNGGDDQSCRDRPVAEVFLLYHAIFTAHTTHIEYRLYVLHHCFKQTKYPAYCLLN